MARVVLGLKMMWQQQEKIVIYFGLGGDESGGSKFKGVHFILVMFSSVCVVTDIGEDIVAWAYQDLLS
ncbi:hypothetical protein TNCV_1111 [Trichonephila clavipes]|nr:hypothetical protein TNCV_1111 [Trichonephila clavipes]